MKLVLIPAGTFLMGSPAMEKGREKNEGPQRQVTISKFLYVGIYEVTQSQWRAVMGTEPWSGNKYAQSGANNAASYISWNDASKFCELLSKKTGKKVSLPTEAQWEYTCRAGSKTAYCFGDDASKLGDYAWYRGNTWDKDEKYAHPVGQKKPNDWGLYDMHGNVFEWCSDWYYHGYYVDAKNIDPENTTKTRVSARDPRGFRVLRSGPFFRGLFCRSATRCGIYPADQGCGVGFRVVVASAKPKSAQVRTARGEMTKGLDKSKPAPMPLQLKRGLILHYDFDRDAGDTVTDQSGKRHYAKVHGARWIKDARGLQNGAYQFDGKSKLDLGDIMNNAKLPVTVALWLRPDGFPPKGESADIFCSDRWDSKVYAGFKLSLSARGTLSMSWGTGKGGGGKTHRRNLGRRIDVQRHKWIHAVGVMGKNRTLTLYINGRDMQSPEIGKAASLGHTSAHGAIGLRFSGMIDEPAVWNRALSKTEVKQLYTYTRGMKK